MKKLVYTAAQIIDEALMGIQDFDRKRYSEAVMYFGRGFRDYMLFHAAYVTTKWLPVTAINTVDFPEDYMNMLSIGISRNGEIVTFSKAGRMLNPISDPLQQTLNTTRGEDETIQRLPLSGYNAKGINTDGYFYIDPANERVVLKDSFLIQYSNSDRTEVVMTYVSNGFGDDLRNTYIQSIAANMLISFIEWKLLESDPKTNANRIMMKQLQYENEADKFDIHSLPDLDELYDVIFQTAGQSARVL
jgi:hypothetical protein